MKAKFVVVGGGVVGMAITYSIARMGERSITVLEQGFVGCGASTRNAGNFRVHFYAPENTRFAIESRRRLLKLSTLGLNPVVRQGGYLWLFSSEEVFKHFKKFNDMWRSFGVGGAILTPDELHQLHPYINPEGLVGGFFGPQDGSFHPDYIVQGYLENCVKMGVNIAENSRAVGVEVKNGRVCGVKLEGGGMVEAEAVVIAAGYGSGDLLKSAGVELPLTPIRKEIGVTEPIKPLIKPLIIDTQHNLYFTQTLRGEVLGSIELPGEESYRPLNVSLKWTMEYARRLVKRVPMLSGVRLMRIWSGYYVMTPDHSHIMGRDSEWPEGLYVATGFSGHGFMLAPLVGELMAEHLLYGRISPLMKPYLPTRFREGRLVKETMVIG